MRAPLAVAFAIAFGWIVLAGYFITDPLLKQLQSVLLGWAVVLAGIAALVAILNLVGVHWRKLSRGGERDLLSLVMILAFIATFAAGVWLTPDHAQFKQAVTAIQLPIETSLLAVLAVSLAFAAVRLVPRRRNWMAVVFVLSAALFWLLGSGVLTMVGSPPGLGGLSGVLERFTLAGGRGILLGIALGSLTVGLRVILGQDRPYRG